MKDTKLIEKCCYCRRCFTGHIVKSKEHVLARALGGDDSVKNIEWACTECNQFKGMLTMRGFIDKIIYYRKYGRKFKTLTRLDMWAMLCNAQKIETKVIFGSYRYGWK